MIQKLLVLLVILCSLSVQAYVSVDEIPGWVIFQQRQLYRSNGPTIGEKRFDMINSVRDCTDLAAKEQNPIAVWDSGRKLCRLYPAEISPTMPSSYSIATNNREITDEYMINHHMSAYELGTPSSRRLDCDIIEKQDGQDKACIRFNVFPGMLVMLKMTSGPVPNWVSFPGSQIVQDTVQVDVVVNGVSSDLDCASKAESQNKMTAVWYPETNQCQVYDVYTTPTLNKYTMYKPSNVSNQGYLPFANGYTSLGSIVFNKGLSQHYNLSYQNHLEHCDYVLVDDSVARKRSCIQFDKSDQSAVVLMRKTL